ncbi:MAG: hypothetical protein ACYCPD_11985 [Acidobacteriaceae bacterium]
MVPSVLAQTQIAVMAGGGSTTPSTTPEAATSAALSTPSGIAVDGAGNLYIVDRGHNLVEKVDPAGNIVVVAGGGHTLCSLGVFPSEYMGIGNNPRTLGNDLC